MAQGFTSKQKARRTLLVRTLAQNRVGKRAVKLAVSGRKQRIRQVGRRRGGG